MTDDDTLAWVTAAARRNQAHNRPIAPRPQYGGSAGPRDIEGDYLDEAARVMMPGRSFAVHRDDAGARLVLLEPAP